MKKKAFLDQYKKEALFSDGFEEFDSSREIVQELINEYEAAETPEYVNWVLNIIFIYFIFIELSTGC